MDIANKPHAGLFLISNNLSHTSRIVKLIVSLVIFSLLFMFSGISQAVTTTYQDRNTWLSDVTAVSVFDFDNLTEGEQLGASYSDAGFMITSMAGIVASPRVENSNDIFLSTTGVQREIKFTSGINAIGFDFSYYPKFSATSILLKFETSNGDVYQEFALNRSFDFFGIISDVSFDSFSITTIGAGLGPAIIGIDNLSLGTASPVPVPGALVFFASGLLGFSWLNKRLARS